MEFYLWDFRISAKIENKIRELLGEHGVSSGIDDIEMTQVFEDRLHERRQVTLKVQGHEFKGFVHEGEIQWFHPHPKQKLNEEHVEKWLSTFSNLSEK